RKNLEQQLTQAKKMESIGQLAAGIAHEINTPAQFVGDNIRFIKEAFDDLIELNGGYSKLLGAVKNDAVTEALIEEIEAAYKKADPEYLVEEIPLAIDQSLDGITRISNIVRAMKEFSHPGGKDLEATDLNQSISNTITVASNEWKYIADVETDLAEDLPSVKCFPQEINQVILNLIVNAAHAIDDTREGESADKGSIKINTRQVDDEVEVRVTDSGCGIPDDIKHRIFDPFFTTKDVGKGSGQGLAMAYKTIVDQHKGKLEVESTIGRGTTFTIRLPINGSETLMDEVAA
ncbi:MAG: ATP-binding protein, partial [Gammaproteobacteria bacterium]|nr:ATP-binding protein [Gammaproteobacteria bacterium]